MSAVIGAEGQFEREMMLEHPEMTREQAEALYLKAAL